MNHRLNKQLKTLSGTMALALLMGASGAAADTAGELMQRAAGLHSGAAAMVRNVPADNEPARLQAAQQACLQEKAAEAQAARKTRRGFGRLLSAVNRVAARTGAFNVRRVVSDVFQADATVSDLKGAADDLGLTPDEMEACRNPEGF